jgi:diacylglycerol O-acyltransferase-1
VARRHGEVRPGERGSGQVPEGAEAELRYPENIGLANMAYFLLAPTLCYQISYPRSKRFRARWMVKRLFMLTGSLGLMLFVTEQYIQPTIDNSLRPLRAMDWLRMVERILKLSLPTLYWWLAMFYTLFDLWLNVLAEVLRFGDREFYKVRCPRDAGPRPTAHASVCAHGCLEGAAAARPDTRACPAPLPPLSSRQEWWNATTVGEYWRLWNQPVHKWMLRHVYFPLIRHGVPKFYAGLTVFFVSAVFHEVLVGVPLHMLRLWAFWGLMAQVPLMVVTEWLKNALRSDRVGNVVFWVSFVVVGQPLAMILYYHDYRTGLSTPFS